MAGGADAGVDDDGDGGLGEDDFDLAAGGEALVGADGGAEGHDGGGADVLEAAGEDGVGVDVGEDDETFFDEDFGGFEGFDGVWQEIAGVGMDFEFDPVGHAGGDGESGEADGFFGVHGTAGVGEEENVGGDEVEDIGEGVALAGEIGATEGDCDDFGAGRDDGVAHEVTGGEFSGAEHESGLEGAAGDDEGGLGHGGGLSKDQGAAGRKSKGLGRLSKCLSPRPAAERPHRLRQLLATEAAALAGSK